MARCRYCAGRVNYTDGTAAEREGEVRSRTEDGENGGDFCTEPEGVPRMERAEVVQGEVATEEAAIKFCLVFAETALQLMSKGERKKSETSFDLLPVAILTQVSFVGT